MSYNILKDEKMEFFYFQTIDIWKRMTEAHHELLGLTYDEYSCLLESDIDLLEEKIVIKNYTIEYIKKLDNIRKDLIEDIEGHFDGKSKIHSVGDLLELMSRFEKEVKGSYLSKYNALLIDIISKIQDQNKKNQVFLTKAITSLREIKEDAIGNKSFQTYNAKGSSLITTVGK